MFLKYTGRNGQASFVDFLEPDFGCRSAVILRKREMERERARARARERARERERERGGYGEARGRGESKIY